ncbi:MAG: hypothetical protein M9910_08770 [Kiritimatiellae bacterium]|nr:hypothetical protein [Kiritimatiellia bacterium]
MSRDPRATAHRASSAAGAIPMLIRAKAEKKLPRDRRDVSTLSLFFNAEEVPDGATIYKCAPPIRERMNNEQLWGALLQGTIDMVAPDHFAVSAGDEAIGIGRLLQGVGRDFVAAMESADCVDSGARGGVI